MKGSANKRVRSKTCRHAGQPLRSARSSFTRFVLRCSSVPRCSLSYQSVNGQLAKLHVLVILFLFLCAMVTLLHSVVARSGRCSTPAGTPPAATISERRKVYFQTIFSFFLSFSTRCKSKLFFASGRAINRSGQPRTMARKSGHFYSILKQNKPWTERSSICASRLSGVRSL